MSADARFAAYEAIQRFLTQAKRPVAFEPGEEPMPLSAGSWELRVDGGKLLLQVWTTERNLVRRITDVQLETKGQLNLTIERFGKRTGVLQLLDVSHAAAGQKTKRAGRLAFRENFRRFLLRQFPGWRIAELSSDPDLEHSLSPSHPRALLKKGNEAWAAIGAANTSDADFTLSFGLIWLDYLRRREAKTAILGLAVFLPEKSERATCQRIRCLDPKLAEYHVFVHAEAWEQRIDVADAGNMETSLPDRHAHTSIPGQVRELTSIVGVELVECAGEVSVRVRGLEFARWNGRELRYGIESKRLATQSNQSEIYALAASIARSRDPGEGDRRSKLFSVAPERWLESRIRENLVSLDARLVASPVYSQAPSFAAGERGIIDLLTADVEGRLNLIEIKATEDLHLPLQALDYWARVKWHLDRGEFAAKGYFPGLQLAPLSPRMLLIAPALHFHPTTETIVRYFSSDVEVERIGLAASWRSELKVMFRACGGTPVECEHNGEEYETAESAEAGPGCTGASESG
jgi:hypothetical protein